MQTSQKMIDLIIPFILKGSRVLEPSAGEGKLAHSLNFQKECIVDCIELNGDNVELLKLYPKGVINKVIQGDFLKLKFAEEFYDAVVAVPPYKDNIDCQHIMKMYEVVRTGGLVISYTLPIWTTGIYTNQREFRKWLEDKTYTVKFLEDKSYVLCPKMLLIIQK